MNRILYISFAFTNIVCTYIIVRIIFLKSIKAMDYLYLLSGLIINMCLSSFYINLMNGISDWINYVLFLFSAIAGLYAIAKGNSLIVTPARKKKQFLTKEEINKLNISKKEKVAVIVMYIISLSSVTLLYLRIS